MFARAAVAIILAATGATSAATAVRSGMATAEWITASTTCQPAKPIQTAIRLTLDDGWHTYWSNPGEGGMMSAVTWKLPVGWSSGRLAYPVPKRFRTASLTAFGHDGVLVLPVTLTPPRNFHGRASLRARLSWLTCDEQRCVPGEAELTLDLTSGAPTPTADAPAINQALAQIPRPLTPPASLEVVETRDHLELTLPAAILPSIDPAACDVFPATPHVIDPAADIRFSRHHDRFTARVKPGEYADRPVRQLTLVLAPRTGRAVELTWHKP